MQNFHDYFFDLPIPKRNELADRVGTTRKVLTSIAGGFKTPSLPMATRIVRSTDGQVGFDGLLATLEKRRGSF